METDSPNDNLETPEIIENPLSPIIHTIGNRQLSDTSIVTGHIIEEFVKTDDNSLEKPDKVSRKRVHEVSSDEDDEEGLLCPICFEHWTNVGDHRLTSLKCGHLFGHRCIKRWLKGDTKNCPTCKVKAHVRDMRFIYARTVKVQDTTELELLRNKLDKVTEQKRQLESDYQNCVIKLNDMCKQIEDLKKYNHGAAVSLSTRNAKACGINLYIEKKFEMASDAGCRVCSYNAHYQILAVSQKSQGNIFNGFGVKLIDMKLFKALQFVYLSQKQIRNIEFSPLNVDLLLTVSLDQTAKIYDVRRKCIILVINTEIQLWSCCWDASNPNLFYVGGQAGTFLKFDINNTQTCLDTYKVDDMSPTIALRSIPAGLSSLLPNGGVLICTLKSCWVTDTVDESKKIYKLPYEGSFISLSYDRISDHILISARPCSKYNNSRHIVATLTKIEHIISAITIFEFAGGTSQKSMSRSSQLFFNEEHYVAAYDSCYESIFVWSMTSEQRAESKPVYDVILDLCPAQIDCNSYLLALTETTLFIYRIKSK